MSSRRSYDRMADAVRFPSVDAVEAARGGRPDRATAAVLGSSCATAVAAPAGVAARERLESKGVSTPIASIPSFELFLARPAAERAIVIEDTPAKVASEAAARTGWDEVLGSDFAFLGMTSCGAGAPGKEL